MDAINRIRARVIDTVTFYSVGLWMCEVTSSSLSRLSVLHSDYIWLWASESHVMDMA